MRLRAGIWMFVLMTVLAGVLSGRADAQEGGPKAAALPGFIIGGLKAYKNSGPDAAVQTWLKGSPIDGNQDAQAQLAVLHQVQDLFGPLQSYEVISSHDLGPRTRIIYIVLEFERGPLFTKFVVYRADQGWILANFLCNTHDEAVFPVQ
jgi:hypothetical protein